LILRNGVRDLAVAVDDLLIRIAVGRMSLLVPRHEVGEEVFGLSPAEQIFENTHDSLLSRFEFCGSPKRTRPALPHLVIAEKYEHRPDDRG
jgi:hypothetical protein